MVFSITHATYRAPTPLAPTQPPSAGDQGSTLAGPARKGFLVGLLHGLGVVRERQTGLRKMSARAVRA